MCVDECKCLVNLCPFLVRPRSVRELRARLYQDPSTQCIGGKDQSSAATRTTYDPSMPRIKRSGSAHRRSLATDDATIERGRKPEDGKHADVEGQKSLFGRGASIECREETHGDVEHNRLGLMIGHALANDGHRGTCCSNRRQVAEDVEKGLIDAHAFEMSEFTPPGTEVGLHDDIGLKRAAEPSLALSGTAGDRCDLAVILGQESDNSVRVAIVDRAQE